MMNGILKILPRLALVAVAGGTLGASPAATGTPADLLGTWRGTSVCTDRVLTPACKDEVVVYEFTAGPNPGSVHWKADKIVDGMRQTMGAFDLTWAADRHCWSATFQSARVHSMWCLQVDSRHLTGTGRLLPGNELVRRIDARKD
jgi:hypothetical protein